MIYKYELELDVETLTTGSYRTVGRFHVSDVEFNNPLVIGQKIFINSNRDIEVDEIVSSPGPQGHSIAYGRIAGRSDEVSKIKGELEKTFDFVEEKTVGRITSRELMRAWLA